METSKQSPLYKQTQSLMIMDLHIVVNGLAGRWTRKPWWEASHGKDLKGRIVSTQAIA
jgi:hypothetical protein